MIQKTQVAGVQAVPLYRAELSWNGQKWWSEKIEKLVNEQGMAITDMVESTPVRVVVWKAVLHPAIWLLNKGQ